MKIKGGYNCLLLHGLKCNKATSIPLEISRLDGQKQQRERQMGRGDIIMPNTLWLFLLENSTSLNYHRGIFTAEARKWNFSILLLRWWFLPWESMWLKIVWEIVTEKQRGCLEVVFFFEWFYTSFQGFWGLPTLKSYSFSHYLQTVCTWMALGPTLILFQPYFWDKATVMYSSGKTGDDLSHSESLLHGLSLALPHMTTRRPHLRCHHSTDKTVVLEEKCPEGAGHQQARGRAGSLAQDPTACHVHGEENRADLLSRDRRIQRVDISLCVTGG